LLNPLIVNGRATDLFYMPCAVRNWLGVHP
jgi:hypothetical protein